MLKVKLFEPMLIPGLFQFLLDQVRAASEPGTTSAVIDHDLDWLEKIEAWKKLPVEQRPADFSDAAIERMVPVI